MAENWKEVGDIFATDANIVEVGEFTASSGNNVRITEEDVDELLANIKEPIPFIVKHDSNNIIGYATKFAKDKSGSIRHKGIIHDSETFKRDVVNGMNRAISPEIDYTLDHTGKIIGKKITRLAFVDNPAMSNTATEVTKFCFSAPEVTMTGEAEAATKSTETAPAESISTVTQPQFDMAALAEAITAGVSKKFEEQINSLKSEIDSIKSNPGKDFFETKPKRGRPVKAKDVDTEDGEPSESTTLEEPVQPIGKEVFDQYAKIQLELKKKDEELQKERSTISNMLQERYEGILTELKNKNIDTAHILPMIGEFAISDKIKALEAFKATAATNMPVISATTNMGAEGGSQEKAEPTLMEILRSYGDTNNPYAKRLAELKGLKLGA